MSAQKKTTAKSAPKKTVAKSTPKKKTTSSKATATKTPTKKVITRSRRNSPKKPVMKSFIPCKETVPFMEVRITVQTIYWLILALISVAFVMWVYTLQAQIYEIYDQINEMNISSSQFEATSINR